MKKLVLVLGLATLFSCEKSETDCGCYRIVAIDKQTETTCESEDEFGKNDCVDAFHITYSVISECNKKPSKKYKTLVLSELPKMQKVGDCYNSFSDY
jgi:hypothetical protein